MINLALNAALINTADKIPSTSSLCDRHAVIDIGFIQKFLNLSCADERRLVNNDLVASFFIDIASRFLTANIRNSSYKVAEFALITSTSRYSEVRGLMV